MGPPVKTKMAVRVAARAGLPIQMAGDVAWSYIAYWLGRRFEVSAQVIEKRLAKDGLWPQEETGEPASGGWRKVR